MFLAYTMGNKEGYNEYLKIKPNPKKLGRTYLDGKYYSGGCCWPTFDEIKEYIKENKSQIPYEPGIYGILLPRGWNKDTTNDTYEEHGFYSLLVDSTIVFVDDNGNMK